LYALRATSRSSTEGVAEGLASPPASRLGCLNGTSPKGALRDRGDPEPGIFGADVCGGVVTGISFRLSR
jgi:hypothetical protein